MAKYATGTPELLKGADDIMETKEQVDQMLRQLNTIVDGLEASWKGEARRAFKALNDRFDKDARLLCEALGEISHQMSGTARLYEQQESRQSESFSAISARLNL